MPENKIYKSFLITLTVLAGLICCNFIKINIAGYKLKSVDLFSDIRKDTVRLISKMDTIPKQFTDSCKAGMTCFEDYSPDKKGLSKIFEALRKLNAQNGKVRIAMFGDSFIEGDIFCSDVRDTLQTLFGGTGVGYVPITSEVAQFRNTIFHSYDGFETYTLVKNQNEKVAFGGGGFCFKPLKDNYVKYSANKKLRHLEEFKNVKLFYTATQKSEISYSVNNGPYTQTEVSSTTSMGELMLKDINASSIKFQFDTIENLNLYGVSMEDANGLYVDNFAMRGNSGLGLFSISDKMHRQFDSLQHYDLVILQYGLNVITPTTKELSWYVTSMVKLVNHLKADYPNASFLMIGVSDKSCKKDGQYVTMESVPLMVNAQRMIAEETQITFWDLYHAMGGENSMVSLVENTPPLANKDYTHLNGAGGKKIAGIFTDTFLYAFKKYNDQTKQHTADSVLLVKH